MRSNWLPEIVKRSENGPFMKGSDFDMAVIKNTADLVRKHSILYNPQVIVPSDDEMVDRLYEAGIELILRVGVYNQSTERCIKFSREEIEEALALAPREVTLGMGEDTVIERHRLVESDMPCIIHSGPTGTPTSEKYQPLILLACAQEPLVEVLGAGSVATYMGQPVIPRSPLEIIATRRDAAVARDALRRAGRPGMSIDDAATPLTCAGKISAIDEENGLRKCDALLVSMWSEFKTDYDQLSRVAYLQEIDMHICNLFTPLIGGLGGGAEGTAVICIASHIVGILCYNACMHANGFMSLKYAHSTGRMGLWISAMTGQAIARNTPLVSGVVPFTRSGLCTPEVLWEVAANTVTSTVCGSGTAGVGATGGTKIDHTSGLEARFNAEVSHAALKMKRFEANEFVLECLSHYEHVCDDPPIGKPFPEIYNVDTLEPLPEWLDIYHQVRNEIIPLGLDLNNGWKEVRSGRIVRNGEKRLVDKL
jgi:methylamine--corrinoid protein Co-methyltransferase